MALTDDSMDGTSMCLPTWLCCGLGPLEWEKDGSDWQMRQVSDRFNRRASRTGGGVKRVSME